MSKRNSSLIIFFLLIYGTSTIGGCAPGAPKPLHRDSSQSILQYHKPVVPPGHKDFALKELHRGLLFFELGNYLDADTRFANACKVIEQIAGDEAREKAAITGAESSKTNRGEPYERAAAYFYRGVCRYKRGDYSGALAAFRHSLACDAETRTKEQKHLEDFTISHFMAAMCYWQLGERENAEAALRIARTHAPGNPYLAAGQLHKNFVGIIAVGQGPYLRPSKLDVAIKRVDCQPSQEAKVELYVDGQKCGEAAEAMDLFVQAKSQSWGEMDTVRVVKTVARRVVAQVPVAGIAANLIQPQADIRCWRGLPRKYYIFAADIPPGTHSLSLKFRDSQGEFLPRYDQVWFDVPVRPNAGDVFYLRSRRNCQNRHGLEPKKITREAEPKENSKS